MTKIIFRKNIFAMLVLFSFAGVMFGCDNVENQGQSEVLTENDFVDDSSLIGNLETNAIVTFLEHLFAEDVGNDTAGIGTDILPVRLNSTTNLTICWQDDDPDAEHIIMLIDSSNNLVLSHTPNDDCEVGVVLPGDYTLEIQHDGNSFEEFTVFVVPDGGNGGSDGIASKIYNRLFKNAYAQGRALQLSVFTNRCNDCELEGSNLEGADLRNADLSGSNMMNSDFLSAKISDLNLVASGFSSAIVRTTNLAGTDVSGSTWNNGATCEEGSVGQCIQSTNGDRKLKFKNKCKDQEVWLGIVGAALQIPRTCSSDTDCDSGQKCNTTQGICQWTLPSTTSGSFHLSKSGDSGDTAVFDIPVSQTIGSGNDSQLLNINFYVQTGCQSSVGDCTEGPCGGSCETAPCVVDGKLDKPCPFGTGPMGPLTQGELNLFRDIQDTSDVSNINGTNVPIEITPSVTNTGIYDCGNPGGTTPVNNRLKGCTWSFNPTIGNNDEGAILRYVKLGGDLCTNGQCTDENEVCGLSYEATTNTIAQSCGKQIGWFNANEICKDDPSFSMGSLTCNAVNNDLFECIGTNAASCYTLGVNSSCCGCPIWGSLAPTPVCRDQNQRIIPNCCVSTNTSWTSTALPWAQFDKDACPTAYSYPFDDKTDTFDCPKGFSGSSSNPNSVNYTITFCPDGKTGI